MSAPSLPSPPPLRQVRYLRRLFADPQSVLDEIAAEHGPNVRLGAGPVRLAIVGDPQSIREVFALGSDRFRWNHKFNVLAFVVGSGSMIVSDGADHARRRSSVQAAFSRRRLNRWIPMILERTDLAIDRLLSSAAAAPGDVRMYRFGRSLALEVVLHALFGERMAEHAEELGDLFQRAQDYLEQPAVRQIPHRIPRTARARVRADRQRFDALVDAEIDRRRRHPTGDPFDVLEVLVVDGSLSDAEIRDQVNTLIGAGYDTTAATLAWTIACTASDDSLWRRLRDEADDVLGPIGGDGPGADRSGNDELMRLDLAARTVRETMRLHPAGVLGPREATSDIVVDGRRIARGTLVLWSAHLAGRDPGCWDDPLRFDPDRFVDPTPEQREMANLAWVPFGGGARNCIGFALAQMELTLVISRLAQRVDVELVDAGTPRAVGLVVNRPEGGVPASVRPALTPTRPNS